MSQTPEKAATPLTADDEAELAAMVNRLNGRTCHLFGQFTDPGSFTPPDVSPVILATWMKSGTTLLQQLFYQLSVVTGRVPTDPNGTDFDAIDNVCPHIEITSLGGPTAPHHAYSPSGWKSHEPAHKFEFSQYDTARFIVVVREGRAAMRSFANYAPAFFANMDIPEALQARFYELLFRSFMLRADDNSPVEPFPQNTRPESWFDYISSWRDNAALSRRVLFIIYEDMVSDMGGTVRAVADFLGFEADETAVDTVVERCSKKHMLGQPRFNSIVVAQLLGLDPNATLRVRPDGMKGFEDVLSLQSSQDYTMMLQKSLGVPSYNDLCRQLRERNKSRAL